MSLLSTEWWSLRLQRLHYGLDEIRAGAATATHERGPGFHQVEHTRRELGR
jgi:hypothetical protein